MSKSVDPENDPIRKVKLLTIISLFSDDELLERLVLKGGNALALAYGIDMRVSADLDLSMASQFDPAELGNIRARIAYRLEQTFRPEGWVPFDVIFEEKPQEVSEDLAGFWGGYHLEFKIIERIHYERLGNDLAAMRQYAQVTGPGQRKKFDVDISRHEHCEPKQAVDFDGYTVYVYTPVLLVCEKLRAICQQMSEYDSVVKRARKQRTARPRDFLDLHTMLTHFKNVNMDSPESKELLARVFAAKRVPMHYLSLIRNSYDQHSTAWRAVQDTVRAGVELKEFRFYFNYVVELVERLHPVGDV